MSPVAEAVRAMGQWIEDEQRRKILDHVDVAVHEDGAFTGTIMRVRYVPFGIGARPIMLNGQPVQ